MVPVLGNGGLHPPDAGSRERIAGPDANNPVLIYERMGRGFESDIAAGLEWLALCYGKMGEIEKGAPYSARARQIREQMQKG